MKIVIWGIGKAFYNNLELLNMDDVVAIIDMKYSEGSKILEKSIINKKKICDIEFDYIVISSQKFYHEIAHELVFEFGIDISKIITLAQYSILNGNEISKFKRLITSVIWKIENKLSDKTQGFYSLPNNNIITNTDYAIDDVYNIDGFLMKCNQYSKLGRIYQITHKKFNPINRYHALAVGDNELPYQNEKRGDNIAELNPIINEATAMYWIWKNDRSEWVGINHYRRVFESELSQSIFLQYEEASRLIQVYDAVLAEPVFMRDSVKETLKREVCKEAFDVSFLVISNIFEQRNAEEFEAFNKVINGSFMFPCNMIIMKKERYDEYCEWLFPIVFNMIESIQIDSSWDDYSRRIIGFWIERLLTVWIYKMHPRIKTLKLMQLDNCPPYGM